MQVLYLEEKADSCENPLWGLVSGPQVESPDVGVAPLPGLVHRAVVRVPHLICGMKAKPCEKRIPVKCEINYGFRFSLSKGADKKDPEKIWNFSIK